MGKNYSNFGRKRELILDDGGLFYYDYSYIQLEGFADELNKRYDADRLTKPKQVDVYDVVDMLGARIAFEYLSPDGTYLGATLFRPGKIYVWPSKPYVDGMKPKEKFFYGGTIIIDRELSEEKTEQDCYVENFTVMHECFHFDKHQESFEYSGHYSKPQSWYKQNMSDKNSALYKIERQANYAAAAFLMPRKSCILAAKEMLGYDGVRLDFGFEIKQKIRDVGKLFGVNYSPMCYRFQELGILDYEFNPYL